MKNKYTPCIQHTVGGGGGTICLSPAWQSTSSLAAQAGLPGSRCSPAGTRCPQLAPYDSEEWHHRPIHCKDKDKDESEIEIEDEMKDA